MNQRLEESSHHDNAQYPASLLYYHHQNIILPMPIYRLTWLSSTGAISFVYLRNASELIVVCREITDMKMVTITVW